MVAAPESWAEAPLRHLTSLSLTVNDLHTPLQDSTPELKTGDRHTNCTVVCVGLALCPLCRTQLCPGCCLNTAFVH